jgi:hypothetical protein
MFVASLDLPKLGVSAMFTLKMILRLVIPVDVDALVPDHASDVLHSGAGNCRRTKYIVCVFVSPVFLLVFCRHLVAWIDFQELLKTFDTFRSKLFGSLDNWFRFWEFPLPDA